MSATSDQLAAAIYAAFSRAPKHPSLVDYMRRDATRDPRVTIRPIVDCSRFKWLRYWEAIL